MSVFSPVSMSTRKMPSSAGAAVSLGPVPRAGVSGDRPQPRHPRVVDRGEIAAVLRDAAVADGRVLEAILADALSFPAVRGDVEQHREHLAGLRIAVVEEELRLRMLRVPVKHRPLLRIPAASPIDDAHGVVVTGVEQADVRGIVRARQPVLEADLQREHVPAAGVPRDGAALADVSEIVVLRAVSDLRDLH